MAESFLTLYSNNSWTMENTPEMKRRLHWILQVIGCLAIFVGTGLEIYDKEEKNRSHFKSPHAITGKWRFKWTNYTDIALAYLLRGHGFNPIAGLVSIVFIVLSMLNGWAAMYAMKIRHIIKPIYIKLSHYLCGIVAFVIGTYGYSTLHRGCNKICIFFSSTFSGMTSLALEYSPRRMLSKENVNMLILFTSVVSAFTVIGAGKTMFAQFKGMCRR